MIQCHILNGSYSVCRLDHANSCPEWASKSTGFVSITKSDNELSIVCPTDSVPDDLDRIESGFRVLRVAGPLPFDLVGVVSAITRPLADARIPVFVVSTFETDYILVREIDLSDAVTALRGARIQISDP